MPDKLPKGWAKTKLGEVCARVTTIQPGDTPDTEFTYFDIGGIDNETNRVVETKTVTGRNAPSRARQSVQKDDILFSTVRTYLKKIARIERDYPNPVASTGFTVIRAVEGVTPQFLFSQVLSENFLQPLHALQTGSSYPAVRDRDVFGQPVLLAPSAEQKRIDAKLEAILSRVGTGEAAAARALARLKRYRASVLHAAVTGELTRAWRKAHPQSKETGTAFLRRLLAARRVRYEAEIFSFLLRRFVHEVTHDFEVRDKPKQLQSFQALLHTLDALLSTPRDSDEIVQVWGKTWREFGIAARKFPKLPNFDRSLRGIIEGKWRAQYPEPSEPDTAGLPALPRGWTWASIDQLAWSSGYGTSVKCSYEASGPAVLRIPNVRDRRLDFEDLKFATRSDEISGAGYVKPGDLLLIRTNGSLDLVGRAAIVFEPTPRPCGFASYLIRFRLLGERPLWSWLSLAWESAFFRRRIESKAATTAGQYNVSMSGLSNLAIPLPPLDEITEIVRGAERRLGTADRLRSSIETALSRARPWRQSVLQAAFAGRLVPQSADDEPASVLLKKICAAREALAAQPKPKRGRGGRKKKMKTTRRPILEVLQEHSAPMKPEDLFAAAGFDEASVDAFFAELKELNAGKKIREKRDPHERGFVLLEARS